MYLLRFWDVWSDFANLARMSDWGVVVYGAFASMLEGGRLMVFFANSFIRETRQKQRAKEDERLALILAEMNDDLSIAEAREKVKEFRMREEVGLKTLAS